MDCDVNGPCLRELLKRRKEIRICADCFFFSFHFVFHYHLYLVIPYLLFIVPRISFGLDRWPRPLVHPIDIALIILRCLMSCIKTRCCVRPRTAGPGFRMCADGVCSLSIFRSLLIWNGISILDDSYGFEKLVGQGPLGTDAVSNFCFGFLTTTHSLSAF